MAKTSHLYNELLLLLNQSQQWADIRHLKTLIWMVIGLVCSECISLTKWTVYVESRATFAQSHQRRFSRWLHNPRLNIQRLYSPIIQSALATWGEPVLPLIEDTTMLWNRYCLVRISVRYRGRAVPVAWRVLEHKSSSIQFEMYQGLLKRVAKLLPAGTPVRFMADRGFADTKLMRYLTQELGWSYRIRLKKDCWVYRPRSGWQQLGQFHLAVGQVILLQGVKLTKAHLYGPVHLALGCDPISGELWYIVSDVATSLQTFQEYGERFDIEEEFLDEKSNGFQLEQSLIRSPIALSRLCLVLAIATLLLTAQGQQVVAAGKRRWVDCHWQRGNSYLRLGWNWIKGLLHHDWSLFPSLCLSGQPDPEPARASRKQAQKQFEREFTVKSYSYLS